MLACLIPCVCVLLLLGGGEARISPSQLIGALMTARKPPAHHSLQSLEQERTLESWNIGSKQNPVISATPILQGDVKAGQVQLLPPSIMGMIDFPRKKKWISGQGEEAQRIVNNK